MAEHQSIGRSFITSHYLMGAAMFKQLAIAGALAIVATSSFAGGDLGFYPSRYVGADVGSTKLKGQSERSNSHGVYLGYVFAPNFALEVEARRLGEFDFCCHHLEFDQAAISLAGLVPLGDFRVFGRIGYNKLRITAKPPHVPTETNSGNLIGVGLGFAFSPTVAARVEIQKPSNDLSNVSFGVMIRY
jgi:OOP family OmpA-OmpF porin